MCGLKVFVDKATTVELAQGRRDAEAESQERLDLHRSSNLPGERFAAWVLEHQHGAPVLAHESQRPHRPCTVQFIPQCIGVSEALEAGACRVLRNG